MFVRLCDVDGTGWATNPKPQATHEKKLFPRAVLTNARPVSVSLTLTKEKAIHAAANMQLPISTKDVDFGSFVMFLPHTVRIAAHRNI